MARKYGEKAQSKVERAMHERKHGTLKSGRSGKKVTSRKQAIAIGLSEARQAGAKVPQETGRLDEEEIVQPVFLSKAYRRPERGETVLRQAVRSLLKASATGPGAASLSSSVEVDFRRPRRQQSKSRSSRR